MSQYIYNLTNTTKKYGNTEGTITSISLLLDGHSCQQAANWLVHGGPRGLYILFVFDWVYSFM